MADVPQELKQNNWVLYEMSQSADPALASQYVGKLVSSLQVTMRIADNHEYDILLNTEFVNAQKAWFEYAGKKNSGVAMETVCRVLSNIGHLLYDKRFSVAKLTALDRLDRGG